MPEISLKWMPSHFYVGWMFERWEYVNGAADWWLFICPLPGVVLRLQGTAGRIP